ncbi:MAG: single-stranded DNA-binding protein [Verrucomicrobia bacterium]|nr:single-stranded DNA-binding protein [Verrucomicrobiota bacterium]
MSVSDALLTATDELVSRLRGLSFAEPVTHVYNPLEYARAPHELYVQRFGDSKKRVLFLGMNPGPWGMAQTGVPFGEIALVRDWMGISAPVQKPVPEHPKRPVVGFDCDKSEVSGRRLWGLFSEWYPNAEDFFADHYVVNYCPLVWMEASSRNRTPDKLPAAEMAPVEVACDAYLAEHLRQFQPDLLIGVGGFAEACLARVAESIGHPAKIGRVLHPSPASPAANRDWAGTAARQLRELGVPSGDGSKR